MKKKIAFASIKTISIPVRKVRLVLKRIKKLKTDHALAILKYTPNAASKIIFKLLKSAIINGVKNYDFKKENIYIANCFADEAATLKRIRARAKGVSNQIKKRTSNISIFVAEYKKGEK